MILTVNLNTSIDRTLFIDDFVWDKTIRSTQSIVGMGGKATDASWILSELGYANVALGFAASDVGRQMERMLQERGGKTDFVWVKGETRTNIVVIKNNSTSQSTLTSSGLVISEKDRKLFLEKYSHWINKSDCVLIGGSVPKGIPPSIYENLIRQATSKNIPVVFDASGPGLHAGILGRPSIIKPNIDELSDLVKRNIETIDDCYIAAKVIHNKYKISVVATLGSKGAIAVLPDRAYQIMPLKVPVVSTAGAGDGVLAGLAASYANKLPIEDGLRLGFAAAAAVCLTSATADCHKEDVDSLLKRINIQPYK